MVALNMLWKLSIVVAFGFSATATSTDIAPEQPKKESFLSRFFGKNEKSATKSHDVSEPTKIDTQKHSETGLPKYDVEWYLLPKPENRAALRSFLPWYLSLSVPYDCNEAIETEVEQDIREYFLWSDFEWYMLPEPESRAALRFMLPSNLAAMVPEDCNEPIELAVEKQIWKYLSSSEHEQQAMRLS
uniref:Small open reading frame n=2 Tax=Babesia bovis TaxID=5865 RepID=S6BG53_BABBO|nr:small open reading frame [Babesia bovis]BAN65124.1 small open reading frame [Babesia bovis]